MTKMRNRLANETSPYLQQHASNPVEWYPWGDEALKKARDENKPILLSVGYSACHWCHVMAHESFEDPETAKVMNELFVNIKVDREERPDLDKVYQLAHQMLVQRPGGWPLTMFLTADDHSPFFGGTYFPDKPRHGMPAFTDILQRVERFYRENGDELAQQSNAIRDVFERIGKPATACADTGLDDGPIIHARQQLEQDFDSRWGGFGSAPKFPHPTSIERLLRHWRSHATGDSPDLQALFMTTLSLQRMAQGGIYDHLGGGFYRYAVDGYWMIPHFEKMLYDNGPLLALYSQAWAATNEPLFERVAHETADWVMREMQSPEGGYYSTLDADSEGGEGAFYVWQPDEIESALSDEEYAAVSSLFGLDREANFEGHWHLYQANMLENVADNLRLDIDKTRSLVDSAREKLLAIREKRDRPARDEKILTAWNGLMISGMAAAARHLHRNDLAESALRAARFIQSELWIDGRLRASFKDGRSGSSAYLDDYAFLLSALIDLLQLEWRSELLDFAVELADTLLEHYRDRDNGGFFFTSDDQEKLIHRPRPLADEATPSGNGVAALALARLGHLIGEPRYIDASEETLRSAWGAIIDVPHAHCSLLNALEETLGGIEIVIIRGSGDALVEWQRAARLMYAPRRLCFAIPADTQGLPEGIATKQPKGEIVAYRCRGSVCGPPLTSLAALTAALRETG
jgi:hypothetical protein